MKQLGDKRKTKERSNKQEKGILIKKAYELGEFDGMDVASMVGILYTARRILY
jgi:hypothetical protein